MASEPAPSSKPAPKRAKRGGFFAFRTMITGTLIKILYVVGMLLITFVGIYVIGQPFIGGPDIISLNVEGMQEAIRTGAQGMEGQTAAATRDLDGALLRVAVGVAIVIIGNIAWRIHCELFIIIFSIHEILGSIEANQKSKG